MVEVISLESLFLRRYLMGMIATAWRENNSIVLCYVAPALAKACPISVVHVFK